MTTSISQFNTGNFPGSQVDIVAKGFKKRFRDQSIIPWITNSEHKGEFKHQGTKITISTLPVIHTYRIRPGDKVKYQLAKGGEESFYINRERGLGLHFLEEDLQFARFDIKGPTITEAAKRLAEDTEAEFFQDIIVNQKCHVKNTGVNAGFISGVYNLGTPAAPVELVDKLADESKASNKIAGPKFFTNMADCMDEMPGAADMQKVIVCHTAVANRLHTSDLLTHAEWMGDAKSVLRGGVKAIGELGGCRIMTDNKLPILKVSGQSVYPVIILNKSAISFVEEISLNDENMKDINYWGSFSRRKLIYDWFVLFPEFFGIGYVKL